MSRRQHIAASLLGVCAGFFAIHSAAVGLLNRRLASSRGPANSLYVLCYYAGGAPGITVCGYAYSAYGWGGGLVVVNSAILLLPFRDRLDGKPQGTLVNKLSGVICFPCIFES